MPSFPRIFQRTANPAPAGQRPADPIAPPRRDGLLTALRNRVQRAGAAARRSTPSLNGCTRFLALIGESFRNRGVRARAAQQPVVPHRDHPYGSLEPMFHEAQQPAVIHVPSRSGITIRPEFLNCEDYLSLFAGGTETDLFKAVHEFAEKVYSAEPFVFLKALESAEANMSAKPDMSAEIAADLVKKFFTNGEPLEVNVGAEFVSTLTSDLGSANDDTERIVAAFAGVRQEAQRTAYLSSYKSFVQHYKGRL